MRHNEVRYRLVAALLQADGPLDRPELAARSGLEPDELAPSLRRLVAEGLAVEGDLRDDRSGPHYRWKTRWEAEAAGQALASRHGLQAAVDQTQAARRRPDIDDEAALAFHDYVINSYAPPKDKRFLVFLQCSVRRPFSSSPSHASMRRAISLATGRDPRHEFQTCPVHVVVLASNVGPVPYELEDVYPANVRGGGVKHFSPERYARVRPILAGRISDYITRHRGSYEKTTTFTHGRYAEVMEEAGRIAGVRFPILPDPRGARVIRMGKSRPRTYWAKHWVQLYLEIVSWLTPAEQAQAQARLRDMEVHYTA